MTAAPPRPDLVGPPAAAARGGVAGTVAGLVRTARPRQWVKQVLVLAAPASAGVLLHGDALWRTAVAVVTVTLAAAGTYLLNDAGDVEADRLHPRKRHRPVASGQVPVRVAVAVAAVLLVASVAVSWVATGWRLALVVGLYAALTTAYSRGLKHVPLVELLVVAAGFVLRALAGAAATRVPLSEWFVIVASFGSLFMVVGKRYAEVSDADVDHVAARKVTGHYPVAWLRQVLGVSMAVTLLAYCLFAFERGADARLSLPWFQLSIVPVVLGVLQYALQLERGQGGAPEEVVLRDRVLQSAGAAWVVLFALGVARA